MVGEDMHWAEGREVVEKKVVYERSRAGRGGGAGGAGGVGTDGRGVDGSGSGLRAPPGPRRGKVVKRQSRGRLDGLS